MGSVKIIRRKDKAKGKPDAPLYLRITKNRKSTFKSLGYSVSEKQWNPAKQRVRATYPNSARLNALLAKKLAEAEKLLIKDDLEGEDSNIKEIKDQLNGNAKPSFSLYAKNYLEGLLKHNKYAGYKKLNGILSKLDEFTDNQDLGFSDIDRSFLKSFEEWMKEEKGNRVNTIHSNLKFIRRLFNLAIEEQLLEVGDSPFLTYKLRTEKTTREFLTEDEVGALYNLELTGGQAVCRDMFVFACDTGLRISDLLTLKTAAYADNRITTTMRKTGETFGIMVPSRAKSILTEYIPKKKTEYLFPPLRGVQNQSIELQKAIMSKTAHFNAYLKQIGNLANIEKRLTFHVSRHTFATRALRKGIRIEYVSALLGHNSLKTTKIYAKIVNSDLDEAMKLFE